MGSIIRKTFYNTKAWPTMCASDKGIQKAWIFHQKFFLHSLQNAKSLNIGVLFVFSKEGVMLKFS